MQRCELAAQSTKHGNKQCLCLRSPCSCAGGRFSKLKYKPRTCAHDAHQRGVLRSAAIDLARRRRRNFARRHNGSCKMTHARMAFWKRGPGSLIAATGLRKLASSQHGAWLAANGRGENCRLQRRQALPRAERARRCDAPLSVSKARIKYRPSWDVDLGEIFPIAMGRRPIAISEENAKSTSQEG